jgi:protein subunit release factor A
MSALPEAKLDVLLAHHASLEAAVLGQLAAEEYVKTTRELSDLNPLIDAVKIYRAAVSELKDLDTMIADSAGRAHRDPRPGNPGGAAAQGCHGRPQRDAGNPCRHRR